MVLRKLVEDFISNGDSSHSHQELLNKCVQDESADSMVCVRRLFEETSFEWEEKIPAAWTLASWKKEGLDELCESTIANSTHKNIAICILVLSTISANFPDSKAPFCDEDILRTLKQNSKIDPTIIEHAQAKLIHLIISFEDEDEILGAVATGFTWLTMQGPNTTRELFVALSSRWLTISQPLLLEYERLIQDYPNDESKFQEFFTNHPQFLDPMAVEIWPLPNLHGAKIPDFVVRLFDNSYLIVEIETPSKLLVTRNNIIAATATQAISQAVGYRSFINRMSDAATHFPGVDEVHCLVVVGLERNLSDVQRQTLRTENYQRHALRIVGFDWLAERAKSVQKNLSRRVIGIRDGLLR